MRKNNKAACIILWVILRVSLYWAGEVLGNLCLCDLNWDESCWLAAGWRILRSAGLDWAGWCQSALISLPLLLLTLLATQRMPGLGQCSQCWATLGTGLTPQQSDWQWQQPGIPTTTTLSSLSCLYVLWWWDGVLRWWGAGAVMWCVLRS